MRKIKLTSLLLTLVLLSTPVLLNTGCSKKQLRKLTSSASRKSSKKKTRNKVKVSKKKPPTKDQKELIKLASKNNGIEFVNNMWLGLPLADYRKKKVLLIYAPKTCPISQKMIKQVHTNKKVLKAMKKYVVVTDSHTAGVKLKTGDEMFPTEHMLQIQEESEGGVMYSPTYGIFKSNGQLVRSQTGAVSVKELLSFLK